MERKKKKKDSDVTGQKPQSLKQIADAMRWECYEKLISERTLGRGLKLVLIPSEHKWKLTISRETSTPTKKDYKTVAKAFFDGRVKHIRQPSENSIEITTAEDWTE